LLPAGGEQEHEIRACAVHTCELLARRAGVPPRTLDNWLWNGGQQPDGLIEQILLFLMCHGDER
jgi:hypothetical protein